MRPQGPRIPATRHDRPWRGLGLGLGAGLLSVTGCTLPFDAPDESGRVGIAINDQRELIFVVHVCSVKVKRVSVAAVPADAIARWNIINYTATRSLDEGLYELNPLRPSPLWQVDRTLPFDNPDQRYSVAASDSGNDGSLAGLEFVGAKIDTIGRNEVLIRKDNTTGVKVVSRADFEGEVCNQPGQL